MAVVIVWGTNFVVIKIALGHLPPLLFAALRFTLAIVPAIFFLPRPAVGLGNLALYGVLIGVGHHGGAWKVAYADFVTAMMAFFLLMWLINTTPTR